MGSVALVGSGVWAGGLEDEKTFSNPRSYPAAGQGLSTLKLNFVKLPEQNMEKQGFQQVHAIVLI